MYIYTRRRNMLLALVLLPVFTRRELVDGEPPAGIGGETPAGIGGGGVPPHGIRGRPPHGVGGIPPHGIIRGVRRRRRLAPQVDSPAAQRGDGGALVRLREPLDQRGADVYRGLIVGARVTRWPAMNEARLSHLPFWGPSEAFFFLLIQRPSG